ncbi:MAG: hypothetical protein ABIS18_05990 [Actinomycetota bacterium]
MANLQIKNLPEDLHEELRRRARLDGVSVRAYLLRLIQDDLVSPSRSEWLAGLRSRRPVDLGRPVAELVGGDRSERGPASRRR